MCTTRDEDKYAAAKCDRQKHVDAIVRATARNKIVVAGPGTGKTYLFRQVLDGKKNTLTLTFVNALVEDLSLELYGLSEVRTLHGFARQQLQKATQKKATQKKPTQKTVNIFPKLSVVIRQDAVVLLDDDVDFDALFNNKSDPDGPGAMLHACVGMPRVTTGRYGDTGYGGGYGVNT